MGEGLFDLWGLGESEQPEPASGQQAESSSAFRDAISSVNESLQSAIANATPEEHAGLDADRQKLCEAYQVASSRMVEDEGAGKEAMDRVLEAAGTLNGKAAQCAEAAAAARAKWEAQQEKFDEMALQVNELADAGHEKGETLQQLCGTIREKANGANYGDSAAAVEELGPKLEAIMEQHNAMIAEAEAAAAQEEAEGSWWGKLKDAAGDAYDWATGQDDEHGEVVEGTEMQYGPDEEEGEEISDYGDDEEEETEAESTDDRGWHELSDAERRAWGVLGWDEEKWNNNTPPASYSKSWWELTRAEREAAKSLGYNEKSWDREGDQQEDDPLDTRVSWDDLHPIHRKNWEVLGWDRKKWNNNTPPPSQFKSWSELTPNEQQAAENLGYDEASWNQEGESGDQGRVQSLIVRSQNERALKSRLLQVGFEEADGSEYNDLYAEVGAYLDLANQNHEFTEYELTNWSTAISELARKRRNIAGSRASNEFQEKRNQAVRRLAGHRRTLISQRKSLANIQKAFKTVGDMQDGVAISLELKTWLTTLENSLSFAADPTKLQAIDSAISELVNQVDPAGDQINNCVEKLAGYVKSRAAQLEGYESKAQLLSSIKSTVALIRQTASDLRFWVDQYEAAVALESAPGG